MRPLPLLLIALGCAGLPSRPEHYYRAIPENGAAGHHAVLRLAGEVEYVLEATASAGMVRLRTTIENRGERVVTYDAARTVVAAADGAPLRMVSTE